MTATGAIVLAGGASSRMGRSKAHLDWDGAPLLARVVEAVAPAADLVVVVGAPGQPLPPLGPGVAVARDARPGRGPLQGMLAGLEALAGRADRVFVSGVDAPALHPRFVARVLACLRPGDDAAVPVVEGRSHPLAAAYRAGVEGPVRALLEADRLRVHGLLERLTVRRLSAAELLADPLLAAADPGLASLANVNTPADYAAARAAAAGAVG